MGAGGEIFQRDAIDLAGGIEGQRLEKHDLLWSLIADARFGELDQVQRPGTRNAGLERKIGADVLPMEEIVQADHACALYRGVGKQRILDLLRGDVGAVMDDDLLVPATEP